MRISPLIQLVILTFVLLVSSNSFAGVELKQFDSKAQEDLYRELIFELRCLVCQNQNLADSNAELAVDLRRQTYEMIKSGSDKQDVIDYMVARYGEFVLYRPPFSSSTFLLWLGPFALLFIAVVILLRMIKNKKSKPISTLSSNDKEKVRSLLDDNDNTL
jgi:cytochrome c-type biogenesis protein CcmH